LLDVLQYCDMAGDKERWKDCEQLGNCLRSVSVNAFPAFCPIRLDDETGVAVRVKIGMIIKSSSRLEDLVYPADWAEVELWLEKWIKTYIMISGKNVSRVFKEDCWRVDESWNVLMVRLYCDYILTVCGWVLSEQRRYWDNTMRCCICWISRWRVEMNDVLENKGRVDSG